MNLHSTLVGIVADAISEYDLYLRLASEELAKPLPDRVLAARWQSDADRLVGWGHLRAVAGRLGLRTYDNNDWLAELRTLVIPRVAVIAEYDPEMSQPLTITDVAGDYQPVLIEVDWASIRRDVEVDPDEAGAEIERLVARIREAFSGSSIAESLINDLRGLIPQEITTRA